MKKALLTGLVALSVTSSVAFTGGAIIDTAKSKLTTMSSNIQQFQSNETLLKNRVTALKSEVQTLSTELSELKENTADYDVIKAELTRVQEELTTAEEELTTLREEKVTLTSEVERLTGEVTQANSKVEELTPVLSSIEAGTPTDTEEIKELCSYTETFTKGESKDFNGLTVIFRKNNSYVDIQIKTTTESKYNINIKIGEEITPYTVSSSTMYSNNSVTIADIKYIEIDNQRIYVNIVE